ncbi:MAG: hypothetical protein LQ340_001776 [Diploschistes diacapsis]|nr:MAG: hypothetical protein LQ340_001776 [Diploschistes diacapsis]
MSSSNIIGNRNSTPETSHSLRPPTSRNTLNGGHVLRASADMSGLGSSALSGQAIRPSSEVYPPRSHNQAHAEDATDRAATQWIAEIEEFENTLEGMATATLEQDFKDELSAIEQWFKVLSEPERTAALYALLQQTTQIQNRFFIQVLQEMAKTHPVAGMLSPANFNEKDAMSNRMGDAAGKLGADSARNSLARPPPSPFNKRTSGLDQTTINAMFPEAAAAIAKQKEQYTQQTGNQVTSNRNSTATVGDRSSLVAPPTISTPVDAAKENLPLPSPTPWGQRPADRPKSSSGQQQPMGHFSQPPPSAGLRSPRPPQLTGNSVHNPAEISGNNADMPLISPYTANASWASLSNTPMVPTFNTQQPGQPSQADMVANATAMKLAAMSTVNNRIMLDDVRKYRRPRSNDHNLINQGQFQMSPGLMNNNVIVVNESGQPLNNHQLSPQQLAAIQMQQQAQLAGRRSRPTSPGIAMSTGGLPTGMSFSSPQAGGYLAAYDSGLPTGMSQMSLGQFGLGHEGYISDHSDARGRSPRGRRGTSKPPEDPTDPSLLQDIPAWLRSLRLHKYTDNLKDLQWQELVELDEKGLEDRGVAAAGARKKMLKTFEQVREAKAVGKI